ncbi:MAG: TatD family hydrolase [Alteromonadaceae bacterium]|nr:TatD family hydrolase [Alteromonadaceae bacterium]
MIDIGINLTNKRFDKDRDALIERAKSVGISSMLVTGTNVIESQKADLLCQQYPTYLYSTAGVHPHDADHVASDYLDQLTTLASKNNVVAIGECGLDFNRNFSSPAQQERVFCEQISLAAALNLPLFLHQRDAFEPWIQYLEPYIDKVPAMVSHCFTGNREELDRCLVAGMYIGITGWICDERRGQELREIVKHIPLNRLMIETDAPYLTPRTIRPRPKSSRNEPSYLPYIVQALVQCTEYSEQDIIEQSSANAAKVFSMEQDK